MVDIFNTHGSPEVRGHERWNKTAMGKSLDGFQEWWEDNLKVSSVQASRVLTLSPAAVWTGTAAVIEYTVCD
ncbi:hypothetical protein J4Q44_G00038060 [Coregonus suidteri]|uniref:Uncharacterized protein n=1 Tax=Coregonus suidteri TaxID=861788 RepID=A0AAN8M7C4_9TELE